MRSIPWRNSALLVKHERGGREKRDTCLVMLLAMLCVHLEDLRGRNAGHRQAAREQSTRETGVSSPPARAWGSGPQATLSQPEMGVQIVPIFRARLPLHQRHILFEGHDLAVQAFDRDRRDVPAWLPDFEVLLSCVHPARDQAFPPAFGSHSSLGG